MDVTPAAPAASPAPWLIREFSDLRSTLERYDANLTSWENHGSTYPDAGLQRDYDVLATRFDTARTEFARVRPDASTLNARLGADALKISRTAGQLDVMSQHGTVFGSGWSSTLDAPIRDAAEALDLLLGAPAVAA
ncbi:MAG: hypothetical protein JWM98_2325 [Thermoleophilia bacterium]|nr:hypothetical protein [Thermoleophilia bacterium]